MNKKLIIILILVSVVSYVAFVETNNYFNGGLHDRPMNVQDLEGLRGITCNSSIFTEKKCTGTTIDGEIIDLPVRTTP